MRSAGLLVEEERRHGEFIEVVATRGAPSATVVDPLGGFAAEDVRREGCFAEGGGSLESGGAVSAVLVNPLEVTRICDLEATLFALDGDVPFECHHLSGALFVPPASRIPLRVELRAGGAGLVVIGDAPFACFARRVAHPAGGARRVEARLAVVPHAFRPPDSTLRWLPSVGARWTIDLG